MAGVHQTTVSLALRNHPRIPEKTRKRIQALAAKLGYRQDPRFSELMRHLRTRRTRDYQETLAYIADERMRSLWRVHGTFAEQLAGAKAQAGTLGYRLDEFWLGRDGLTGRRVEQILRSRGIRGVLVGPLRDEGCVSDLRWERYAAVVLNYGLQNPDLHRVVSHHVQGLTQALEILAAHGCLRVGLVQSRAQDLRLKHLWTTAFHGFHLQHPELPVLPICTVDHEGDDLAGQTRAMLGWFRAQRPDVILAAATEWLPALKREGVRCPADVGYVLLDRHPYRGFENCAGIDQQHTEIGAIAVSKLAGCLARGEFGIPAAPTTTMLASVFVDGDTLPRKIKPSKAAVRNSSGSNRTGELVPATTRREKPRSSQDEK